MKRVKPGKIARRRSGRDDLRPEYDFGRARPNKYAARYAKDSLVVTAGLSPRPAPPALT
jgi:hypothetical protein